MRTDGQTDTHTHTHIHTHIHTHTHPHTHAHTDITKLIAASRNFANGPKSGTTVRSSRLFNLCYFTAVLVVDTLRTGSFKLFKLFKRPFPGFLTILTL